MNIKDHESRKQHGSGSLVRTGALSEERRRERRAPALLRAYAYTLCAPRAEGCPAKPGLLSRTSSHHSSEPARERDTRSPYGTEFYLKNPTPLGAAQATFGTGILFEEPNPTGSRPRDLIGLYRVGKRDPNRRKGAAGKRGGATVVYSRGNRAPVAKATHALAWRWGWVLQIKFPCHTNQRLPGNCSIEPTYEPFSQFSQVTQASCNGNVIKN